MVERQPGRPRHINPNALTVRDAVLYSQFGIDMQMTIANPIADVGEVAQGRTAMAMRDVGVGAPTKANRLHKVLFVFRVGKTAKFLRDNDRLAAFGS